MRILLLLALPGCGLVRGGSQIGTEYGGCEVVSSEPAPAGIPDGFSFGVADVEPDALGSFSGTVVGGADPVALTLVSDGPARLVRLEPEPRLNLLCLDTLELPVRLTLTGPEVDEETSTSVRAWEDGSITVGFAIDADDVGSELPPPDGDDVQLALAASLDTAWTGSLEWVVEETTGSGGDAAVTLRREPVWDFRVE